MRRETIFFILLAITVILPFVGCTAANMTAEGVRYFNQARYDQAQRAFLEAFRRDPNNPDISFNLAETYHQSAKISLEKKEIAIAQQQYDEANRYYRICLSINPNHLKSNRGLAAMYLELQQPKMAFDHIINWLESNPASQEPKIELARLHQEWAQIALAQNDKKTADESIAKATELLQQVITTEPNNYRAWRAIGFIRENNGDRENAIAAYQQSLLLNPNQTDLKNRLITMGINPTNGTGIQITPTTTPTNIPADSTTTLKGATIWDNNSIGSIGYK
ncbi:MAG: tetratricopeptide repeat protein [Planctomycetaceae bacterium]|jgi:tetratricopeptide (TPR) repeat protein|nr:tetratricopeptide repeat protein [Planctomycetaceae bacterium]